MAGYDRDATATFGGVDLTLPVLHIPKGSIIVPRIRIPAWLDSTTKPPSIEWDTDEERGVTLVASGGFCAPAGIFDFFGPLSDHDEFLSWKRNRERELAAQRIGPRMRRWWRAHWWPAVIADLRDQLRDEEWED